MHPTPGSHRRRLLVGAAFLAIAGTHALVGTGTHPLHVVHVVFGGVYLLPIVAAALWFGGRASVALAIASAAAYLVHLRQAGSGDPMESLNHLAMAGVYLFVGGVSAALVRAAERERLARVEAERSAQRTALVQGLASLSRALREKDDGTAAHCERVAALAARLGRELSLAPERIEVLRLAALAHDVGKIGVRDDVLFKPHELTPDERRHVERHPAIAAEILRPIRGAEEIADIVLCHHECPDGSGYPRHLAGDRIPLEARALRVADVFTALVERRPYKRPLEPHQALARMRELEGKLDPRCSEALARAVQTTHAEDHMSASLTELSEIARSHHVHFDVEPEIVMRGSERVKVGFQVNLWGVHPKGARALPGCPKCWDVVEDLRRIAREVVPPDERVTRAELAPFRPALYDSRVVPNADEVSVTIRLIHRDGYDHPIDACEERCLKEIRARLRALGVQER